MNKLIILIGMISVSVFGQVGIDQKKDSLNILKLQFKSNDTLPLDKLRKRILIYENTIKVANNFNASGLKDSAMLFYKKAHKMFPNEVFAKDRLKGYPVLEEKNCYPEGPIRRAELEKATATAEAGYYFEALKFMLNYYGSEPKYMIEKRKKILEIIELSEK